MIARACSTSAVLAAILLGPRACCRKNQVVVHPVSDELLGSTSVRRSIVSPLSGVYAESTPDHPHQW